MSKLQKRTFGVTLILTLIGLVFLFILPVDFTWAMDVILTVCLAMITQAQWDAWLLRKR